MRVVGVRITEGEQCVNGVRAVEKLTGSWAWEGPKNMVGVNLEGSGLSWGFVSWRQLEIKGNCRCR